MIRTSTVEELEKLLLTLVKPKRGEADSSSYKHLRDALYDWKLEKACYHGFPPYVYEEDSEILGVIFYRWTSVFPKHVTLRHIFTLEKTRGKGVAESLMNFMYSEALLHEVFRVRFFINKTAINFYKKLGFKTWGISKTGLPFVYCFIVGDKVRDSNKIFFLTCTEGHMLEPQLSKQKKRLKLAFETCQEL